MALLSALRTVRGVNTTVIGKPAAHARSLATGYLRTAFLLGALAAVSAAAAWMIGGQALLIFALAAVVLLAVASERWQRYGRARVGVKAEETVLRAVRRSGEAHTVLNGMLLGAGGDADHIVLGPGAAVIETKAGFGKLYVRDGRVYSGPRQVGKDEIGQVRRQAQAASRLLGVPVLPIVCVADAKGGIQRVGEVVVCNSQSLAQVLANAPRVLPGSRVSSATDRILAVHAKQSERRQ